MSLGGFLYDVLTVQVAEKAFDFFRCMWYINASLFVINKQK